MHRAVVSLPDGLHAQVRWVAGELCAAAGLTVADGGPALTLDPAWDLRSAAATLARSEELGGAADEHGRFPAAASTLAAGAAPLDDIVLALREAATAPASSPRPSTPGGARFAVALTHDIDTPWRWSGRGLLGAGARLKGALAARDSEAARVEASRAGARARCTGCSAATPTGRTAASPRSSASTASARPASCSRRIAIRTTAPRRRPTPRAARASWPSSTRLGLEVGLHASYTCLADERAARRASAPCSRACSAGRSRATATTTCACRGTTGIRALDRLGFSYDTTLGYAERPGPRAGLSFPFRPWDVAAGAPMRILELPLVLMDATLAEERYLGLSPEAAWDEVERVLDHLHDVRRLRERPLAQRPLRPRLRARLGPALRAPARRHRGARRPRRHGGRADALLAGRAMRVLIVSFYFPPAGGGGVQRVLKLCRHLPELGIDVDVLAPDDPKWSAVDPGLAADIPAATTVHRARYRGPSHAQTPAARLAAAHGRARARRARGAARPQRAAARSRDRVVPRCRARRHARRARARDRRRALDLAAELGARHRRRDRAARGRAARGRLPRLVARQPPPPLRAAQRARQARGRGAHRARRAAPRRRGQRRDARRSPRRRPRSRPPGTPVRVVANGCDFDEFDGLEYTRGERMRIVHAGSFFGQRTPRPFLGALRARCCAPAPSCAAACRRPSWASCGPAIASGRSRLGLGDALALEGFRPHAEALAAMRAADVLLLLVPRAGGRGLSVVSGKVYEYLAAERPILALVPPEGDAATLLRDTGSAWIADPDDEDAIARRARRWPSTPGRPGGWTSGGSARSGASGSTAARAQASWPSCCGR